MNNKKIWGLGSVIVLLIVAVVHSGEEPLKPRHPGNRIKELACPLKGAGGLSSGALQIKLNTCFA